MAPAADPDPASQLKTTPARYASEAPPANKPGGPPSGSRMRHQHGTALCIEAPLGLTLTSFCLPTAEIGPTKAVKEMISRLPDAHRE